MAQVRTLTADQLIVDATLNVREGLDPDTVAAYVEAYDELPPVEVCELPDGRLVLVDGFHRNAAREQSGRISFLAKVVGGTWDDARERAILSNLRHGKPYSREEKQRAVEAFLRLHPDWADNRVAQTLGRSTVSAPTVGVIRARLVAAGELTAFDSLVGRDGKLRPVRYDTGTAEPANGDGAAPAPPDSLPPAVLPQARPLPATVTRRLSPEQLQAFVQAQQSSSPDPDTATEAAEDTPIPHGLEGSTPTPGVAVEPLRFPLVVLTPSRQRWELVHDDVRRWTEKYRGEKFQVFFSDMPYHLQSAWSHSGTQPGRECAFGRINPSASGKGFMGQEWDGGDLAFQPDTWAAVRELLFPGGLVVVYAAPRNADLVAGAMRQGGIQIHPTIYDVATGATVDLRDILLWVSGQGMPKGANTAQQLRKLGGSNGATAERDEEEDADEEESAAPLSPEEAEIAAALGVAPAFAGRRYGIGAYRPNAECILIGQVPPSGRRIEDILTYGTGTFWIEGTRIVTGDNLNGGAYAAELRERSDGWHFHGGGAGEFVPPAGRVTSNLLLTHSPRCHPAGTTAIRPLDGPRKTPVQQQADGLIPFSRKAPGYQKVGYTAEDGTETMVTWACHCFCTLCGAEWEAEGRRPCPECGSDQVEWACPVKKLDEQSGTSKSTGGRAGHEGAYSGGFRQSFYSSNWHPGFGDVGGASRYYYQGDWLMELEEASFWLAAAERLARADPMVYCAKAGTRERDVGLQGKFPCLECGDLHSRYHLDRQGKQRACRRNGHPTVKPLGVSLHLAALVRPPDLYEPSLLNWCSGSGTEFIAALLTGYRRVVGVELGETNCAITEARTRYWTEWAANPDRERVHQAVAQRLAWLQALVSAAEETA